MSVFNVFPVSGLTFPLNTTDSVPSTHQGQQNRILLSLCFIILQLAEDKVNALLVKCYYFSLMYPAPAGQGSSSSHKPMDNYWPIQIGVSEHLLISIPWPGQYISLSIQQTNDSTSLSNRTHSLKLVFSIHWINRTRHKRPLWVLAHTVISHSLAFPCTNRCHCPCKRERINMTVSQGFSQGVLDVSKWCYHFFHNSVKSRLNTFVICFSLHPHPAVLHHLCSAAESILLLLSQMELQSKNLFQSLSCCLTG